ncbi:MAG TPA: ABC transporter substrate binding protein, partial [Nitrospinota bacterium]|nr:ABC transporter substrate binding protein [Nitrospinota bacterium]
MTKNIKLTIFLLIILCTLFILSCLSYAYQHDHKHVLVLNSYHKGYVWSDKIMEGILSVLESEKKNIDIHIEYMDTKRIHDDTHFQNLYELIKHKFSGFKFDAILTSDDNAFHFLLKYKKKLFPDVPAVFCGIEDFKEANLHKDITGVVEDYDLRGTINIALKLHPNIKEIFVISDKTRSGQIHIEKVNSIIPDFKDSVKFTFLIDLDAKELQEKIKNLPDDSIVLFLSFFRDKSGRVLSYDKAATLVTDKSNIPVYTCWDFYLGYGVIGGMMVNAFYQGKTAGGMALRILNGERIENIPVLKKSPNRYMFDYKQMQRFGIKLADLPVNSIVINKPSPFYTIHKNLIWTGLIGFLSLSFGIFIFLIISSKRKRAEEALRLSQFSVDKAADAVFWMGQDARLVYVNETACRKLGYSRKKLLSMTVHDIDPNFPKEVWQEHWEEIRKRGSFILESHHKKKDGTIFPVEIIVNYINFDGKEFNCAFARDIAERKKSEEEIKKKTLQLKTLYEVDKKIASIVSREELLPWIAKQAARLLEADECVYRIRGGDYLLRGGGTKEGMELMKKERLKIGESLSGWIAKEKKPLIIPDGYADDPRLIPEHRKKAAEYGFRSALGVPMCIKGRVIGVLNIISKKPRRFLKADIELLSDFADMSAIALEKARLYEEVIEKVTELNALYEVNKMITSEIKRGKLVPLIAEQANKLLGADGCKFRLREGDELVRSYGTKQSIELMVKERIKIGESLGGIIAKEKKPLAIEDIREDKRYIKEHREVARRLGFIS